MLNNILLLLATGLYAYAAYTDVKTRLVLNKTILALIILGLIYSGINGFAIQALAICFVMNLFGLLFMKLNMVSPGDMKLFSTFSFYFNLVDGDTLLVVMGVFAIICLSYGMLYPIFSLRDKQKIKDHYFREYSTLFLFLLNKKPLDKAEYKDEAEKKAKTHPFAVQIFTVFIAINIFMLLKA